MNASFPMTPSTAGNPSSSTTVNGSQELTFVFLPVPLHIKLILCILKTICRVIAATGNLCVLPFLNKNKENRNRPKHLHEFIYSLAISDVLVSINVPFVWIDIFYPYFSAGWMCRTRRYIGFIFHTVTINNLAVIGVERYILTCRPTSRPVSRRTVSRALKGAWILGILSGLLPLYSFSGVREDLSTTHYTIICRYDNSSTINIALFHGAVVICYVLPSICICSTSISVVRMVWKRKPQVGISEKDVASALHKWRLKQKKATMLLMGIMLAFLLTYAVYGGRGTLFMLVKVQADDFTSRYIVRHLGGVFAYANGVINFCIHLRQLPGFWKDFKRNFPCTKIKENEHNVQEKTAGKTSPTLADVKFSASSSRRRATSLKAIERLETKNSVKLIYFRRHSS